MKFLFIGDPLLGLNPLGDSSLAIVRAVQNQKVECFWVTPENLWQRGADIWAAAETLEPFLKDRLPTTSGNQKKELSEFDAIFIRKDPPFNTDYVRLCWSLALYDKQIFQFNRAQLLLRFHEKMVPFEACRQGYLKNEDLVPTFIGAVNRAESWAKEFGYDEMVVKPYLGHAGESITRLRLGDLAKSKFTETMMIQPLLPEVTEVGDRRVIYLNGKILADFVRVPKAGSIVANLAQGGSAILRPMTAHEESVATRLGDFLLKEGIFFAGSDMIGAKVSEVNITSPTGLRSLEKLLGDDFASQIAAAVIAEVGK